MKTLLIISSAMLLFSCTNTIKNQDDSKMEIQKEQVVTCKDSLFLDEDSFPVQVINEIDHESLISAFTDYPKVESNNQNKLSYQRYFSNRTFNENFHTYVIIQEAECADCQSYVILYNISKQTGCIIDKIELSTSYDWENYKLYKKTDFLNDSTFTRVDYHAGNAGTDSTEYGPNWDEKTITNKYRISDCGTIDLIKSDSVYNVYDHKFF